MRIVRRAGLTISKWPNGQGSKADIATGEGWTLTFAWVEAPAPFSVLPGMDRSLTLLEGPGFRLDFAEHPALVIDRAEAPYRFAGDWPAECCPLGGTSLVLNIMSDRARWTHTAQVVAAEGALALAAPAGGHAFAVVLAGEVRADGEALGRHDAVIDPAGLVAAPGARLALFTLSP